MTPFAQRSLLFSPGNRPDMMDKAARSGADGLIFDLEDSVPRHARAEARHHVREALGRAGPPVLVRISHPSTGETEADLEALVPGRLQGVIVPKAEQPAEVALLDGMLQRAEATLQLAPGSLGVAVMVESCLGLMNAFEIVRAAPRVRMAVFASGEEGDFMLDVGGRWTPEGEAMLYPRSKLVCDARAASIEHLMDGVFMNLKDDDALRRECRLARTLGYTGKMAIHPRQVPIIHEVFTPTADEIEYSQELVAAFRAAEREGRGAVQFRGMMVDYANVKRAEKILARAGRPVRL